MNRYDQAQHEMSEAMFNLHQTALSTQQALLDYGDNKFTFIMIRRQVQSMQRELAKLDKQAQMGLRLNGVGTCRERHEANREYEQTEKGLRMLGGQS